MSNVSEFLVIMSGLKKISLKRWIFISILITGLDPVLVLAETSTNISAYFPFYNVHLFFIPSGKEISDYNDSMSGNDTVNDAENYWSSNVPLTEDPQYCMSPHTTQCNFFDPYRTFNGSCNNLFHPTWGIANDCYVRYQPASYEGFETPPKSKNGDPLPPARDIILNIFKDVHSPSPNISLMFTIYGQSVAHDFSRAENVNILVPCCLPEFANHSSCIVVPIRRNDSFFAPFNVTCMNLHRTVSCDICNTTKREQLNAVTSALDASMVYGTDDVRAMELRAKDGTGKLNISSSKHGEFLPKDTQPYEVFCRTKKPNACYYSGDLRVNMHVFLTGITTYFVREHNRLATELKKMNPDWDDEKTYQEARKINTAILQCITYKEYLPQLLGPYIMEQFNLTIINGTEGTKYDSNTRLGVGNEFATAAFRLHSMISKSIGSVEFRFKDLYSNPQLIQEGYMEKLMHGICRAPSEQYDHYHVNDISNYMALRPGKPYGIDLSSIDIMRNRDHGIASYIAMVRFCSGGQVNISTFDDLTPLLMSKESTELLKENYAFVDDIDLWVGIQMEDPFPGSQVGPTAGCIMANQFYSAKFGDRFFWEHEGEVPSFTTDQRNSLKQCSLSRLLCDNANIKSVQKNVMLLPSVQNPEVPCEEIPEIDLSPWKENSPV